MICLSFSKLMQNIDVTNNLSNMMQKIDVTNKTIFLIWNFVLDF